MLGQDAGDVIVDDDLLDLLSHCFANMPIVADRSDAHALLEDAVDGRRTAGLHDDGGAFDDREFRRLPVAEIEEGVAGDAPLLLDPPVR